MATTEGSSAYVIVLVLASCGVVGGETAESQCTVPRVCSFLSSHRDPTDRLAGGRSVGLSVIVVFFVKFTNFKFHFITYLQNIKVRVRIPEESLIIFLFLMIFFLYI